MSVADNLVTALRRLPAELVIDATSFRPDEIEPDEVCEPETMMDIGKRLVLTSGLLTCARYCSQIGNDPARRQTRIDHTIAALLQRTYSLGIASTIVLHDASARNAAAEQSFERGLRTLLWLSEMSPGNFWRALQQTTVSSVLSDIIGAVATATDGINFGGKVVTFEGKKINLWPFLTWSGNRLQGLREVRWRYNPAGQPVQPLAMYMVQHKRDDTVTSEIAFDPAGERQIVALLNLLGGETGTDQSRIRSHSESYVPLFWASHQKMDDLVELLTSNTEDSTQYEWVGDYLCQHTTADQVSFEIIKEAMKNPITIANAILWRCITTDPLSVLIEYFHREAKDIPDALTRWRGSEAHVLLKSIKERADAYQARKSALWVRSQNDLKLARTAEQARLAAIEVARGIGFPVREMSLRPTVEGYVAQLDEFITAMKNRPDPSRMIGALVETAKICEDVLQFVIRFYRILSLYDASHASGLPPGIGLHRGRPVTLGPLIDSFEQTCDMLDGSESGLEPITGVRRGLGKLCRAKTRLLRKFLTWRNDSLHVDEEAKVLPISKQLELMQHVHGFLLFTLSPEEGKPSELARVTPAVLQLNLVTANRCGITTVTYRLTQEGDSPVITLYTRQPVAAAAGVFYGIPRQDRSTRELWVDPVLFAAEEFERAVGGAL